MKKDGEEEIGQKTGKDHVERRQGEVGARRFNHLKLRNLRLSRGYSLQMTARLMLKKSKIYPWPFCDSPR